MSMLTFLITNQAPLRNDALLAFDITQYYTCGRLSLLIVYVSAMWLRQVSDLSLLEPFYALPAMPIREYV